MKRADAANDCGARGSTSRRKTSSRHSKSKDPSSMRGGDRDDGRRSRRSSSSSSSSSSGEDRTRRRTLGNGYALVTTVASGLGMSVLYSLLSRGRNDVGTTDNDHRHRRRAPPVDGSVASPDPERDGRIMDFLSDFVCDYAGSDSNAVVDGGVGYCHPRLSAEPRHRTQRVSSSSSSSSREIDGTPPPPLSHWRNIVRRLLADGGDSGASSGADVGILPGELVMRLPRRLQIWDLDALRDRYVRGEFLGWDPVAFDGDDAGDDSPTGRPRSSGTVAVHKDTGNLLDSGAYLAVHLIRLSVGSRADGSSGTATADEICIDGDGKCYLPRRWNVFDQSSKQRARELSGYLDVLPTASDRLAESPSNPHDHPLFWPSYTMEALFPRYTVTNDLIRHYGAMIKSEYDALTFTSADFEDNVLYFDYLSMRINVLSRAFGVSASTNDAGATWGVSHDRKVTPLIEEMRSYGTSNFGVFLDDVADYENEGFKFRSMCPLLDMYNSHPNANTVWRYDSKTSSYVVHASNESNIPPGHSIVVSYGLYTDGHMFAKYGYINGDGSSPTEVSLAAFHRILGNIGLGRQFSLLPFALLNRNSRGEIPGTLLEGGGASKKKTKASLVSATEVLNVQSKELIRYLLFDDGYRECIDLNVNSGSKDEELKLLKWQHLLLIANNRDMWIVRIPPTTLDARPMQANTSAEHWRKDEKSSVGLNAKSVISTCRLLSLNPDDLGGNAIEHLREGLAISSSSIKSRFRLERHEDALEYRAMMCLVRLCNAALGRYSKIDGKEPDAVGSREWNAWYIISGEVRGLEILRKTAVSEAHKLRKAADTDAAMSVREEGACPLNYSLPLLNDMQIAHV